MLRVKFNGPTVINMVFTITLKIHSRCTQNIFYTTKTPN